MFFSLDLPMVLSLEGLSGARRSAVTWTQTLQKLLAPDSVFSERYDAILELVDDIIAQRCDACT